MRNIFYLLIRIMSLICLVSLQGFALSKESLQYTLSTEADIMALAHCEQTLFAGVSSGDIEIFDLKKREKLPNITLNPIWQNKEEQARPKILHLDCINEHLLITAEGNHGNRDLWLHTPHDGLQLIWQNSNTQKAMWVKEDLILTATLGNVISLYNITTLQVIYELHPAESKFSDFILNEDRSLAALSNEGGEIDILDVKEGKLLERFSGIHKDKVYQLDFKNNVIISGGQDKTVGIIHYNKNQDKNRSTPSTEQHKKSEFIVYSVGLSPSGQRGVYLSSENNTLSVFNTTTLEDKLTLTTDPSLTQFIIFTDENHFISSGDSDQILFWNLEKGQL